MNWRDAQEPALRWSTTAAFVGCGVTLCVSLGDVSVSSTFGLLLGTLLSGVPAGMFWGRELSEATVRRDRAEFREKPRRFDARIDEDEPGSTEPADTTGQARPVSYYDEDND